MTAVELTIFLVAVALLALLVALLVTRAHRRRMNL